MNNKMTQEMVLKPCPFCLSEPEYTQRGLLRCSNRACPAWHIRTYPDAWNRRAALAAIEAQGWVVVPRREPFVVKHYHDDAWPTVKGNGLCFMVYGEEREEVESWVKTLNAMIAAPKHEEPSA
jgi:hypothetical protein